MPAEDKISSDIFQTLVEICMYCSIIFWLGHLSGFVQINSKSALKMADVQLLFHALCVSVSVCLHMYVSV